MKIRLKSQANKVIIEDQGKTHGMPGNYRSKNHLQMHPLTFQDFSKENQQHRRKEECQATKPTPKRSLQLQIRIVAGK
jgi:hypothetical protein